jgi:L-alanine-DL-glutamate epimerase-like enolase superfamily enzyme
LVGGVAHHGADQAVRHRILRDAVAGGPLAAYAELARRSPIAIAAGEHPSSRWDVELLIVHGVQVVQPYTTAVGGLSEMSRVLMRAEASGIQVVPGNWSTALQTAANLHAAAGSRVTRMIESALAAIDASPLRRELERLGPQIVEGRFVRSEQPGLGIDIPSDIINSFAIG